jgi:hypothetical protein
MKINIRLLVLFGLVILLGTSCKGTFRTLSTSTVTPETPSDWWIAWLAQPACKPPCWQNITPGVTSRDDAVSILKNTTGVVITYNTIRGLSWNFGRQTEEGNIILSEDGIVTSIWIGSISDRKLLLKTIVASYNEPQYVKPLDCREGKCVTALVYPDLGMYLTVFVENRRTTNGSPQFEILPDTIINRVYFIESGIEKFEDITFIPDYGLPMKWKGYGEYP